MKRSLVYGLAVLLPLAAIGSTPYALAAAAPGGVDWNRLSDIAQVYGAMSTVLSSLALVGVIVSLILQAKQAQAAQEETSWNSHRELIFKALDDPDLAVCWEPPTCAATAGEWKQIAYINLIVTHWDKAFRLGRITPEQLRLVARRHFAGELARRHWGASGGDWARLARYAKNRRTRQFPTVMQGEYQAACQAGPATASDLYFGDIAV